MLVGGGDGAGVCWVVGLQDPLGEAPALGQGVAGERGAYGRQGAGGHGQAGDSETYQDGGGAGGGGWLTPHAGGFSGGLRGPRANAPQVPEGRLAGVAPC